MNILGAIILILAIPASVLFFYRLVNGYYKPGLYIDKMVEAFLIAAKDAHQIGMTEEEVWDAILIANGISRKYFITPDNIQEVSKSLRNTIERTNNAKQSTPGR